MSAHEKSLLGLFKKKPVPTPDAPAATPTLVAEQEPIITTEAEAPAPYRYTSSWQKAADSEADETAREDVINVHNVVGKLDEIFHQAPAEHAQEDDNDTMPPCLSSIAVEKFSHALTGGELAQEAIHPATPPVRPARFSERLKQRVEAGIQQQSAPAKAYESVN